MRKTAEWEEGKHPRAKDGKFGHGEGSPRTAAEQDRVHASLKDPAFLEQHRERLQRADDAARKGFGHELFGSNEGARLGAVQEEAARIHAGTDEDLESHEQHGRRVRAEVQDEAFRATAAEDAERERYLATPEGQEETRQRNERTEREHREAADNANRELNAGTVHPVPRAKLDEFSETHDATMHEVEELGDVLHQSRRDAAEAIGQLEQAGTQDQQDNKLASVSGLVTDNFPESANAIAGVHKEDADSDVNYEPDAETAHDDRFDPERVDPREDGPPEKPEDISLEDVTFDADEEKEYSPAEREKIRNDTEVANQQSMAEYQQSMAEYQQSMAEYNAAVEEHDKAAAIQQHEFKARAEKAQQALERLHALQSETAAKLKDLDKGHDEARSSAYSEAENAAGDPDKLINADSFSHHEVDEDSGEFKDAAAQEAHDRASRAAEHLANIAAREREELPNLEDKFALAHDALRDEIKATAKAIKVLSKITGRAPGLTASAAAKPKKPVTRKPAAKKPAAKKPAKAKKSANRPGPPSGANVTGMAPRYKLKLSKLDFISLVDTPAQESAVVRLIKRASGDRIEVRAQARVAKITSGAHPLVYCWAFTCTDDRGQPYHDLQGDAISADDFAKAAEEFMADGGAVDEMHDSQQTSRVAFAFPMDSEIATAMLGKAAGAATKTSGLMVAIRPSPEALAKIRDGRYTGVSIAGTGIREQLSKRAPAGSARPMRPIAKTSATATTSAEEGHQHSIDLDSPLSHWSNQLDTSNQTATGADQSHSHAWSYDDDTGAITIAMDSGHTHTVDAVVSPDVRARAAARAARSKECPKCDALCDDTDSFCPSCGASMYGAAPTCTADDDDSGATRGGGPTVLAISMRANKRNSPPVTPPQENSFMDPKFAKMLTAALQLPEAQRAHVAKLAHDDRVAFLGLDAGAREQAYNTALIADPVVYTTKGGESIRKSQGSLVEKQARTIDQLTAQTEAQQAENAVNKAKTEQVELEKSAGEMIPLIGKTLEERAWILKGVNAIPDEAVRKSALEALKGANEAFRTLSKAQGYTGDGLEGKPPVEAWNAGLAEYAKGVNIPNPLDAIVPFLKTAKGAALKKSMDAQRPFAQPA